MEYMGILKTEYHGKYWIPWEVLGYWIRDTWEYGKLNNMGNTGYGIHGNTEN